jgi:hypothetical protein
MSVTLTVRVRRPCDEEKFTLSFDGCDSGSKKCKRSYDCVCGGVWRSLRLAGVWILAVGFVLVSLAGIWLQSS